MNLIVVWVYITLMADIGNQSIRMPIQLHLQSKQYQGRVLFLEESIVCKSFEIYY